MFTYIVRCTCKDEALAEEWIAWLRDEHLADVCEAGALHAEVVRLDGGPGTNTTTCEVHYHFASRAAFNAYQRDHAPRLRAEGLKRFPTERGVSYSRSVGEVVARREAEREKPQTARAAGGEKKAGPEPATKPPTRAAEDAGEAGSAAVKAGAGAGKKKNKKTATRRKQSTTKGAASKKAPTKRK